MPCSCARRASMPCSCAGRTSSAPEGSDMPGPWLERAGQPPGALPDYDVEQDALSNRDGELGTETSFAVSKTIVSATTSSRTRSSRTRDVAVQTSPAHRPGRPPAMPEPHESAAAESAGGSPRRRVWRNSVERAARPNQGRRAVRLGSSRRQVPGFEETPKQTRFSRVQATEGGI